MKRLADIFLAFLLLLAAGGCQIVPIDEDQTWADEIPSDPDDRYKVVFSAGTETSVLATKATVPYMNIDGRFVCRMYYIGAQSGDAFDTYTQAWLKVENSRGNSVYRQSNFNEPVGHNLDSYHFDTASQIFYWQNRKQHAFLAITDLNKLTTNTGDESGTLDMGRASMTETIVEEDGALKPTTYELWGTSQTFSDMTTLETWVREHSGEIGTTDPESRSLSEPQHWSNDGTKLYSIWRDAVVYKIIYGHNGSETYDRDNPISIHYRVISEYDSTVEPTQLHANKYDLRHYKWSISGGEMVQGEEVATSVATQPDIAQALTIMAPQGYTQEANRVSLVFKHCFSKIQVNLQKATDGGVDDLTSDNIQKVELLGVTEEGYVFTEVDAAGNLHAPSYKDVSADDYTSAWLTDNPYGTKMEMFQMAEASGSSLKSFEAIAFGQLKAIRITWKETGNDIVHSATRVVDSKYVSLESGKKYIFNISLKRGTLAVIVPEILTWDVDQTTYGTDGSIDTEYSHNYSHDSGHDHGHGSGNAGGGIIDTD